MKEGPRFFASFLTLLIEKKSKIISFLIRERYRENESMIVEKRSTNKFTNIYRQ